MNPFDWQGPQFLGFYAVLAIVVNVWLRVHVRGIGGGRDVQITRLSADPCRVAYLRGGAEDAVRLAVVALVDRGQLRVDGDRLQTAEQTADAMTQRPLDKALLRLYARGGRAQDAAQSPEVRAACDAYRVELTGWSLLFGDAERAARWRAILFAVAVLAGTAGWKIALALSRGRSNIVFLVILAVVAVIAALVVARRRRTGAGERALAALRTLCERTRRQAARLRPGGLGSEALLLGAVFGLAALPAAAFPFIQQLYPQPSGSSDFGGSSDSSNSSDSGGSGDSGGSSGCGGCGGGGGD